MNLIALETIQSRIYLIRGHKVMLDSDLAALYGVSTKALNRAIRRNPSRFPIDFMFQLSTDESEALRRHFGTSKQGRGGRRYLPYVFTELGVAMLSSVLNSERAIQVNITIMRVFSQLKEVLIRRKDLVAKLAELEERMDTQDTKILFIFNAMKLLIDSPKRQIRIGFKPKS